MCGIIKMKSSRIITYANSKTKLKRLLKMLCIKNKTKQQTFARVEEIVNLRFSETTHFHL
jgi:hypothetical protein